MRVILILLIACFGVSCNPSSQRAVSTIEDRFTTMDFTSIIAGSTALWTNPNLHGFGRAPLHWALSDQSNGFDFLTHEQKLQLGGWTDPRGNNVSLLSTFAIFEEYSSVVGEAPRSGAELGEWLLSRMDGNVIAQFEDADASELPFLYELVNPQTGRFYASFDGSVPEPGGVVIRKLEKKEEVLQAFNGRPGGDLFGTRGINLGWEIVVSSEDPSTILDTAVILRRMETPGSGNVGAGS